MLNLSIEIINFYYPEESLLRDILLKHSVQVRDKALELAANPCCAELGLDLQLISDGAMLHDIGILHCHAPNIQCFGKEPYIAHGVIGSAMVREFGLANNLDLDRYARICERHTGSGITAEEIRKRNLPIPAMDYLPETNEEKLICLADKFFSKSGDMREKCLDDVVASIKKFGEDSFARFENMGHIFRIF